MEHLDIIPNLLCHYNNGNFKQLLIMKALAFIIYVCFLLCLTLLTACRVVEIPNSFTLSHLSSNDRKSGVCSFPPISLDRSGLGPPILEDPSRSDHDFSGRVLAGFNTVFRGGAAPIPCNKLDLTVISGEFSFDLSSIRPDQFDLAFIEVIEFTPVGTNKIETAVPWGAEEGWIGEPGRIQDSCRFQIKVVTAWSASDWWSPPPPANNLRLSEQYFSTASTGGSQRVRINVTSEIRRQLVSGERVFFLVQPNDIALNYQETNRFIGFFTFKLKLQFKPGPAS